MKSRVFLDCDSGDLVQVRVLNAPMYCLLANAPCPWLPDVDELCDFSTTRKHDGAKGAGFYLDALRYAQSLWIAGKPAQALLQLNKAWMSDLAADDPILQLHPPPYRALVWILARASSGDCGYLGNPVRHFQHLASRVVGPRAETRSWRAWLCFHLAEQVLGVDERFPRDLRQIIREGLWIPGFKQAVNEVSKRGWPVEYKSNIMLDFITSDA